MFIKKMFFKFFSIALLCSTASKAMNNQGQQCQDRQLQQTAFHCIIGHIPQSIAHNILRDNPTITSPQLVTLLQKTFSCNMIRLIHQAIWAIRGPIMDMPCNTWALKIAANTCSQIPKALIQATPHEQNTLNTLQNICTTLGIHFVVSTSIHNSLRQKIAVIQSDIKPVATPWINSYIPQYLQNIFKIQEVQQPSLPLIISCCPCFNLAVPSRRFTSILASYYQQYINAHSSVAQETNYSNILPILLIPSPTSLSEESIKNCLVLCHDEKNSLGDIERTTLLNHLTGTTRADLIPTLQELIDRTKGFTLGQLTHIMDEAYLEAAFENSAIQREHIIGAYNRARRQLYAQSQNQQ